MSYFVDSCSYLRLITSNHSRRHKSEKRIFHSTERKTWRQNQNIVLAPSIWNPHVILNFVQITFQFSKLILRSWQLYRLRYDSNPFSQGHSLQISCCYRNEIAWNSNLTFKVMNVMCIVQLHPRCVIRTHLNIELFGSSHLCAVSCFHGRAVLHRCHGSTSNGLTLGKEIGQLLSRCLFGWQPTKSSGIFQSIIMNSKLDGLSFLGRLIQIYYQSWSNFSIWCSCIIF